MNNSPEIKNRNINGKGIEKSTAEWKKRYELITEASGQIIYDYCVDDGSIEWGGSIEKILGYKLSEMTGGIKQWKKMIHRDDVESTLKLLKESEDNLKPFEAEYRLRHKDGYYVDFLDRGFYFVMQEVKKTKLIGTLQNVTLKKRSVRLINGLNSAVISMQNVNTQEDIYIAVNSELKKLNFKSFVMAIDSEKKSLKMEYYSYHNELIKIAEELAGMKIQDLYLNIEGIKEYEDVIQNNKTVFVNSTNEFVRNILPKKLKFLTDKFVEMFKLSRFIMAPLVVDNKVFGTFSVQAEDLTESDIPAVTIFAHQLAGAWQKAKLIEEAEKELREKILAENALVKSQKRLNLFFNQSLDGYYFTMLDEPRVWNDEIDKEEVLDYSYHHQKIVEINDAMLNQYGVKREELVGKPVSIFFEHDSEYGRNYRRKLFDEGHLHVETKEYKFDGSEMWIEGDYVCLYDEEHRITGTFGIQRDITKRKHAEEELIKAKEKAEEMSKVKSSFLANMSHEVRTPLVAILGFSEVLSELVKEEELKNYVEMIHKGGERLLDTLNLILDLSVIESQKVKIELIPLDIVKEVKEVVSLFRKSAERKNIILDFQSDMDSMIINLDTKILRQVMNNLVNNAIKYTNVGRINVSINHEKEGEKDFVAIRIEDTGIGIPKNKQDLIWEEFRQVSEGLSRSFEGTGLGLSITKKFVEKLNGKIFLEKSEENVGSVFTVLFSANTMLPVTTIKKVDLNNEDRNDNKTLPTVLYVEDDPISIDIVRSFSGKHCILESASSGPKGIEKAKSKKYDAVLMDINLGFEMNGIQATKEIRKIPGYESVPIVAITAFAMIGDREEFYECGCTHYISKPFTKIEIVELLKDVLKGK